MHYCSKVCQLGDDAQHKTLCDQFKNFQDQHRPSAMHRRVIFFPHNENGPRFVWLKYEGSGKMLSHDLDDLKQYIPVEPTASGMFFSDHQGIGREYNNTLWMQKIGNKGLDATMPTNRSLMPLLGQYAARWRGPVLCMAPTKYAPGTDPSQRDVEDQNEEDVLIPYDLDTTSLGPHVAFLRWVAQNSL
ncbi:hypothetical protein E8E11_009349 [Didymella keratinophila]|nr:hypothetical protein E8E11_009349 [Didymella keratinophila]